MILPIYLYGAPELRIHSEPVRENSPEIQALIDDMIETMHGAQGIGLAAPQVGRSESLFVVDLSAIAEELDDKDLDFPEQPMVFLNPSILEDSNEVTELEEGCLSIPDIHEEILRPESIQIEYLGRDFLPRTARFEGMLARVIQHEFDHLEGVLFVDYISPFRRRLLKRRLKDLSEGNTDADYPVFAHGRGVMG